MSEPEPILRAENLSRSVNRSGECSAIVNNFSFSFRRGHIYTILGPSGAGKSSLLRLFNRLDEPTAGEVFFDGQDYRSYNPCHLRRRIGYLFQTPYLFPGTVVDNLRFATPDLDESQIDRLLESVSVKTGLKTHASESLSGGEKQRVALARLLATDPTVVLLDEPTSALDPTYTQLIENVIKRIAADQELAVIMVSHQPQQALRMEGEGLLLVAGKLVEHGPVEELVISPQTELGRKYRDRELT